MQNFRIKALYIRFYLYFCRDKINANMIQEIKIKNFLSFKDEVCFSFEATNDKFAEESPVVTMRIRGCYVLLSYTAIMLQGSLIY